MKKVPRPPICDDYLKNRLNKLKDGPEPKHDDDNNNNLSPPRSPPSFPPPSSLPPLQPPSGQPPPPPSPFFPPLSGKLLESSPKNEPPFQSSNFIPIPAAPSALPLAPDDYYLLGPTSQTPSNNLYGSQTQTLSRKQGKKIASKKN